MGFLRSLFVFYSGSGENWLDQCAMDVTYLLCEVYIAIVQIVDQVLKNFCLLIFWGNKYLG